MKTDKLDTVAAAAKGSFCHLKNPFTEVLMYEGPAEFVDEDTGELTEAGKALVKAHGTDEAGETGKDAVGIRRVGAFVLGWEAPSVVELRERMAAERAREGDDYDFAEAGIRISAALITGFQGITRDGKPLGSGDADKRFFLGLSDSFITQVNVHAKGRQNFLSRASSA